MSDFSMTDDNDDDRKRNRRTAWILVSIALVFFIGVIVRRWLFGE